MYLLYASLFGMIAVVPDTLCVLLFHSAPFGASFHLSPMAAKISSMLYQIRYSGTILPFPGSG
jgi:hypothetical protein